MDADSLKSQLLSEAADRESPWPNSDFVPGYEKALAVLLRKAAAALPDSEGNNGWFPIATAPKDQAVDAWSDGKRWENAEWTTPGFSDVEEPRWCYQSYHETYDQWYWDEIEPEPTHWRPIPAGPELTAEDPQ